MCMWAIVSLSSSQPWDTQKGGNRFRMFHRTKGVNQKGCRRKRASLESSVWFFMCERKEREKNKKRREKREGRVSQPQNRVCHFQWKRLCVCEWVRDETFIIHSLTYTCSRVGRKRGNDSLICHTILSFCFSFSPLLPLSFPAANVLIFLSNPELHNTWFGSSQAMVSVRERVNTRSQSPIEWRGKERERERENLILLFFFCQKSENLVSIVVPVPFFASYLSLLSPLFSSLYFSRQKVVIACLLSSHVSNFTLFRCRCLLQTSLSSWLLRQSLNWLNEFFASSWCNLLLFMCLSFDIPSFCAGNSILFFSIFNSSSPFAAPQTLLLWNVNRSNFPSGPVLLLLLLSESEELESQVERLASHTSYTIFFSALLSRLSLSPSVAYACVYVVCFVSLSLSFSFFSVHEV